MRDRFGELLKLHVRRAGLPIRRIAELSRVPRQTLSNWLRGTRPRWHAALPDELRRVGAALALSEREVNELLHHAGCLPAAATTSEPQDGYVHPVTIPRPPGWFVGGTHPNNYEAGVQQDAINGMPAAYLRCRIPLRVRGMGTVQQQVRPDAYRGKRMRLSALIRSEDVERWAGLWMRIEGEVSSRRVVIAVDNMRDRPILGTTDWTRHAIVLDIPVEATQLVFGFLVAGDGHVWVADMRFEEAAPEENVTGVVFLRNEPVNLDFSWPII